MLKGFTLIELLIVVAIIAILAAIAVPNFLEAQVRSKVSRVRSDFRTLATALESYRVDWNRYAPCGSVWHTPPGNNIDYWQLTPPLTTPNAYISSGRALKDPFADLRGTSDLYRTYRYINTYEHWAAPPRTTPSAYYAVLMSKYQGEWLLQSFGPNKKLCTWGSPAGSMGEEVYWMPTEGYPVWPLPYDLTNGTVSAGDVVRTQKHPDGVPK